MLRVYFQIFKKLYHFTNIYSILQIIYIDNWIANVSVECCAYEYAFILFSFLPSLQLLSKLSGVTRNLRAQKQIKFTQWIQLQILIIVNVIPFNGGVNYCNKQ